MEKKLSEIRCRISDEFLPQKGCMKLAICDLFLRKLNQIYSFPRSFIISIYRVEDLNEHLKLTYTKEESFIEIGFYFSSSYHQPLEAELILQKNILNVIFESVASICKLLNIDKNQVRSVYDDIVKSEFINEWIFKDKFFKSPTKNFYFKIKNIFIYSGFESWLILYGADKNMISENLIFKDRFISFYVDKAKWIDTNTVMFKFSGPNKEFVYTVEDLIKHNTQTIPEKINLYFK